jgi:membrane peptidoglycan carboxypeptidase
VAGVLVDVVEEGTGHRAGLGEFRVAGKTGTTRVLEGGTYRRDAFTASFAGFFPARDPQLVFLVKLDRGTAYGGSIAAPVTRATLAAALAARATPLDRRAVASALPDPASGGGEAMTGRGDARLPPSPGPFIFRLDAGPPRATAPTRAGVVPDVRGRSARDAAAALHASGFRVRTDGVGRVRDVFPAAGSAAERGSVVRLSLGRSR